MAPKGEQMTISNFAPKTLEELENIYGDGMTDEMSGDVGAPTGHFYRVGSQIVVTDEQGFRSVENYRDESFAQKVFSELDASYSRWVGTDE